MFRVTKMGSRFATSVTLLSTLIAAPLSHAATVAWTDWASGTSGNPGSATGTIVLTPNITVSYSGQTVGLALNYPSWTPTATFMGGTVSNTPPRNFNAVDLTGGITTSNTITFSSPITDPVMAIWSLGAPGRQASFNFTAAEPFSLQAGGPNAEYGGSSVTVSGSDVLGAEGNGIIQFTGTFSQLTWTNPTFENYYAFTVGVAGAAGPVVPEPAGVALSSIGIGLLILMVLRRRIPRHF